MTGFREISPFMALLLGIAAGSAFLFGLYFGFQNHSDHRTNFKNAHEEVGTAIENKSTFFTISSKLC